MKLFCLTLLFSTFPLCVGAQSPQSAPVTGQSAPLTDQRVIELVRAGVHADELARMIATTPSVSFDLAPAATDQMLKAGVSEQTIKAMAAREAGVSFRQTTSNKRVVDVNSGKPRIYVEQTPNSWAYERGGGSHPQRAELMKTFAQSCPGVIVTNDPKQADFVVSFEREAHKVIRKDNKLAVFNSAGELVFAKSTRALGNAVRGFCSSPAVEAGSRPLNGSGPLQGAGN